MKICNKCKSEKHLIEFPKHRSSKDGYENTCKKCKTSIAKTYHQNNIDKKKQYYLDNKDKYSERDKKYSNTKKELWYQSWLNFHKVNEVLDWHNHPECLFHGYISIDPKETETEFESYKIKNEIGNVYIGNGQLKHKVNVLKPFEGYRITIAFDVISEDEINTIYKKYGKIDINTSFIPIFV
jgi:hypothetical protein